MKEVPHDVANTPEHKDKFVAALSEMFEELNIKKELKALIN